MLGIIKQLRTVNYIAFYERSMATQFIKMIKIKVNMKILGLADLWKHSELKIIHSFTTCFISEMFSCGFQIVEFSDHIYLI